MAVSPAVVPCLGIGMEIVLIWTGSLMAIAVMVVSSRGLAVLLFLLIAFAPVTDVRNNGKQNVV
jgi:hypothetical protein